MQRSHQLGRGDSCEGPRKTTATPFRTLGISTLTALGALLALTILSGCAARPYGGTADPYQFNASTGYPAVGNQSSGM